MAKFCENCGFELHTGSRFCGKCGAAIKGVPVNNPTQPQQQTYTPQQPQSYVPPQPQTYTPPPPQTYTPPQQQTYAPPQSNAQVAQQSLPRHTKTRRGGGSRALCIALAVLLVMQTAAVALYGWPGFLVGGGLGKSERFTIEPGQTVIETKTGVTVDFGAALESEHELSVTEVTGVSDAYFGDAVACYEFKLDGAEHTEFTAPVTVMLPHSGAAAGPGADGAYLCAAWYNEATGAWEPAIYDYVPGGIAISTMHFSEFAMLEVVPDCPENLMYVLANPENLKNALDMLGYTKENTLTLLFPEAERELVAAGLGIVNDLSNTTEFSVHTAEMMGKLTAKTAEKCTKVLGGIGASVVVAKAAYEAFYFGNYGDAAVTVGEGVVEYGMSYGIAAATGTAAAPYVLGGAVLLWAGYNFGPPMLGALADFFSDTASHGYFDAKYMLSLYDYFDTAYGVDDTLGNGVWLFMHPDTGLTINISDKAVVTKSYSSFYDYMADVYNAYPDDPHKTVELVRKAVLDYPHAFKDMNSSELWALCDAYAARKAGYGQQDVEWLYEDLKGIYTKDTYPLDAARVRDQFCFQHKQELLNFGNLIMVKYRQAYINELDRQCNELNRLIRFQVQLPEGYEGDIKCEFMMFAPGTFAETRRDWTFARNGDVLEFTCTMYSWLTCGEPDYVMITETRDELPYETAASFLPIDFDDMNTIIFQSQVPPPTPKPTPEPEPEPTANDDHLSGTYTISSEEYEDTLSLHVTIRGEALSITVEGLPYTFTGSYNPNTHKGVASYTEIGTLNIEIDLYPEESPVAIDAWIVDYDDFKNSSSGSGYRTG